MCDRLLCICTFHFSCDGITICICCLCPVQTYRIICSLSGAVCRCLFRFYNNIICILVTWIVLYLQCEDCDTCCKRLYLSCKLSIYHRCGKCRYTVVIDQPLDLRLVISCCLKRISRKCNRLSGTDNFISVFFTDNNSVCRCFFNLCFLGSFCLFSRLSCFRNFGRLCRFSCLRSLGYLCRFGCLRYFGCLLSFSCFRNLGLSCYLRWILLFTIFFCLL